jgi:hypothetical protein
MEILNIVLPIITGLCACIPLVIQLVKYIKLSITEKNFGNIMNLVLELIPEAEEKFATGAERKAYVMTNIASLCVILNYEVDLDKISEMIDAIVSTTKLVNKQ